MSQPPPGQPPSGRPPYGPPPYGPPPYGGHPRRRSLPGFAWAIIALAALGLVGIVLLVGFVVSRVGLDQAGDDELSRLYGACAEGDMGACDELFWRSPPGSEYEQFGATCGDRVETAFSCEGVLP